MTIYDTERFGRTAHEVVAEAIRSIDKHGEQRHLPMGEYRLERTYAGYWQRTAGAFSWYITDARGVDVGIGSQWTVKECLAAPAWEFGRYGAIYPGPVNDGLRGYTPRKEPAVQHQTNEREQ